MATFAKFKTDAVVFNPIDSPNIPNSLYITPTGSEFENQVGTNPPAPISEGSGSTSQANVKQMQCEAPIRAGKPVSKKPNGKIVEADSDLAGGQQPVGIALQVFTNADDLGHVILIGPNVEGILAGSGFAPGDEIYIGETSGQYVNSITVLTGNNDSYIRIGIADCAAGAASSTTTDLIVVHHIIARPS